jgi:hypothetical protein
MWCSGLAPDRQHPLLPNIRSAVQQHHVCILSGQLLSFDFVQTHVSKYKGPYIRDGWQEYTTLLRCLAISRPLPKEINQKLQAIFYSHESGSRTKNGLKFLLTSFGRGRDLLTTCFWCIVLVWCSV